MAVLTQANLAEANPSPPAASAALSPLGLITVLVGVFLPVTDFFIVNVALPTIDHDLRASAGMLQLVVAGYAIAYALLLVVGGRLGDALGRRRLFLLGMAAFTVTSLACGLAPNVELLVAFRALQGAAAALMLPQVLSTIQASTTGDARNRALGLYGATAGIASAAGQLLGGLLISADIAGSQWRSIFLVNVPVGIVGLIVARRVVPDTRSEDPAAIDTRGTLLLALSLLFLLIPLTEGRSLGWPLWTIVLLAASPLVGVAFVRTERAVEAGGRMPLVPLSLLEAPSMRKGLLVGLPFFTAFGGFMFVYALSLQDGAGLSPLRTGLILLPMALVFLATSLSVARLLARFGRRVLVAGGLIDAAGMVVLGVGLSASWPHPSGLALVPGHDDHRPGTGSAHEPHLRRPALRRAGPSGRGRQRGHGHHATELTGAGRGHGRERLPDAHRPHRRPSRHPAHSGRAGGDPGRGGRTVRAPPAHVPVGAALHRLRRRPHRSTPPSTERRGGPRPGPAAHLAPAAAAAAVAVAVAAARSRRPPPAPARRRPVPLSWLGSPSSC